jgi:tetratricopeptide (TPR) repeat protein
LWRQPIVQTQKIKHVPFQTLEDPDLLNRLLRAIKKPSSIDTTALAHLETTTKNHWNLYASFENSVQYRYNMLTSVSGHLQTIKQLLEHRQPTQTHNHLASLACETAQLMGEIYFDLKDNDTALRYYNTAITLAGETQNDVLLATALGRKSFNPIYSDDPQLALSLLQEADAKLTGDVSDIIRAWLAAREAEALERAERYLDRA